MGVGVGVADLPTSFSLYLLVFLLCESLLSSHRKREFLIQLMFSYLILGIILYHLLHLCTLVVSFKTHGFLIFSDGFSHPIHLDAFLQSYYFLELKCLLSLEKFLNTKFMAQSPAPVSFCYSFSDMDPQTTFEVVV